MKSLIYDNAKFIRYIGTGILCILMVAISEISSQPEMIFPEAEALFIGMLIADKPMWSISRRLFVFIMGVSALAGLWLSIYRELFLQFIFNTESPDLWLDRLSVLIAICAAYVFAAFFLITYQAALLPAVSACILPVLTNAHNWMYPISVVSVALVLVISKSLAERANLIPKAGELSGAESKSEESEYDTVAERRRWLACFPIVFAAGGAAIMSGFKFAAAPPLIVALLTFAGKGSTLQNKKLKIYLLTLICATVGAVSVMLLHIQLQLPMTATVILTVIIISGIFYKSQMMFPPAGALAILPAILPENYVLIYPLMIAAGAAVFIRAGSVVAGAKLGDTDL